MAYTSGNAANSAPPPVTSQTSLPSQTGPMALSMSRRCSSRRREQVQRADAEVEAVEHGVPGQEHADQDEPDRVQIERHRHLWWYASVQVVGQRAVLNLLVQQVDEEGEEQRGRSAGTGSATRGSGRRCTDWRDRVGRAHQAVHDPRLATDLGGEPAELVRDLRAEHREDKHPQQPAGLEQAAPPPEKDAQQARPIKPIPMPTITW